MTGDARQLERIRQRILKLSITRFKGIYRDDAWQNVHEFIDAIKKIEGVEDLHVWAGVYHNYMTGDDSKSPYRDYKIAVETPVGILGGYIRCCAAGSVKDPFDAYDMLISLYKIKDMSELDENKKKCLKITLEQAEALNELNNQQETLALTTPVPTGKETFDSPDDALDSAAETFSAAENHGVKLDNTTTTTVPYTDKNGDKMNVTVTPNDINEMKVLKKSQVESVRLSEMRKHGKIFTKQQLEESFQNPGFTNDLKGYLQQAVYHVEMRLNDFKAYCEYIPEQLEKLTENFIELLDKNQIPYGEPKLEMNNYSDECDFEVNIPILMDIESDDDLYNAVEDECGNLGSGLYAMLYNNKLTISGEIKLPRFTDEDE